MGQSKIQLGITEAELKQIYPEVKSSPSDNVILFTRKDDLHGLPVDWHYRFENQKLSRFGWSKYFQDRELTKVNFEKCLKVSEQLLKDLTNEYGTPASVEKGDTTFVDPYVKHHWGYEVIRAKWKNVEGMNVDVRFKFFGSKGVYFLLLEGNYVDKNSGD